MDNVFDTTKETETFNSAATDAPTPNAAPAHAPETDAPDAGDLGMHISNVVRKGDDAEIILYKTESQRTLTVHYDDADGDERIPYVEGVKKYDKLSDGALVVSVNPASSKRVYATLTVNVAELADKFPEKLSALTWTPRTKARKSKDSAED